MNEQKVQEIDIDMLVSCPLNPRTGIDKIGLEELAESIVSVGVLQPILVRPKGGMFEIVSGERRYRASKLAGLKSIPAIVQPLTDSEVLEIILIENAQREDLNDVEKGNSCIRLMKEFPEKYPTVKSLAKTLGMSTTSIRNWMNVATEVPPEIQEMIATQEKRGDPIPQGSITSQVALQITKSVKEPERRVEVARAFADRAIPVHKARKVMKAIKESSNEPAEEIIESVLRAPPDFPFRLTHSISILKGIKTQTSRFFRPDELETLAPGVIAKVNIWEPQFAEVEILDVSKKRLGDFTEADAKREGGYSLQEFKQVWKSIHGPDSWIESKEVTVVHFRLAKSEESVRSLLLE